MTIQLGRTIPAFPVIDVAAAVAFYADRLGFRARHQEPEFAIVVRDAAELHLWAAADHAWRTTLDPTRVVASGAESFLAGTASCRIEVTGIDALFVEYQAAGVLHAVGARGVISQPWGAREVPVLDLHNNLITFFESG